MNVVRLVLHLVPSLFSANTSIARAIVQRKGYHTYWLVTFLYLDAIQLWSSVEY